MTLATSKIVAIESVNEQKDRSVQAPHTVTCVRTTTTRTSTTTTTTTMTKVLDKTSAPDDMDDIPSAQQKQQKILLYESTRDDTQSALLTDDDTNSVNSSLDSKDLESGLKEITQPTQDTVFNVNQIDTQMQSLSFISTVKNNESVHNISRQLEQLDILNDEQETENEPADDGQAREKRESIVSLSSNDDDTLDHESDQLENTDEKNETDGDDSVIVLSDSDSEEAAKEPTSPPPPTKRNISQEPPLKPSMPSSNDPAMYNISSIDSSSMQRVNNFFDNAPFIDPVEPMEAVESSFNSSHTSKSQKEDIYVPETTDEESIDDGASFHAESDQLEKEKEKAESEQQQQQQEKIDADLDEANESRKTNFSDNNIIVDIPVKKSASDQPRQLIRSQSGVRLTASRSSPITKTSGKIDSDGTKRTSSNVILKTPGNCGITVNSSNGQLNIAAKININIQIVEDSSEESSEDNKPDKESPAIQSSEDCTSGRNTNTNTNSNEINSDSPKPKSQSDNQKDLKNNRTPVKKSKLDAGNKTPKTPQTASKLKQFEFVPPKSMTKPKKLDCGNQTENEKDAKPLNKSITSESSENDGFQIDKNIPISPRDQKLLVRS